MLSAGQSAGNILQSSSPFVSDRRERKGISQLAATVEVKRWNKNEQRLIGQTKYLPASLGSKMLRKFKSEGGQGFYEGGLLLTCHHKSGSMSSATEPFPPLGRRVNIWIFLDRRCRLLTEILTKSGSLPSIGKEGKQPREGEAGWKKPMRFFCPVI